MANSTKIRDWLLDQVILEQDADVAGRAAAHFGVSRQAIARHLSHLVKRGSLVAAGNTKARRYSLAFQVDTFEEFPLGADFQEDVTWSESILPRIAHLPKNTLDICEYGLTEMLNNARDHSGADEVSVGVQLTAARLTVHIADLGVGIFRKIKEARELDDERHAILELTKGKLTTDPAHHTGEGIFYTSRAFDSFVLSAGSLALVHKRQGHDWLMEIKEEDPVPGTSVTVTIDPASKHTIKEVFDGYSTEQDDYAFKRTHFLVGLAETDGTSLVSRSQARRIMARCEQFREVVLDFKGIESIGPAFADQIFRVWQKAHSETRLIVTNASEEVERMVRRAKEPEAASESGPTE